MDNVLQKTSIGTAKRQASLIKTRLKQMTQPLWELVRDGSKPVTTQALFASAIAHSALLKDFLKEDAVSKIKKSILYATAFSSMFFSGFGEKFPNLTGYAYAQSSVTSVKSVPKQPTDPQFIARLKGFIQSDALICDGDLYVVGPNLIFKGASNMQSLTQSINASELDRLNKGLIKKYKLSFYVSNARLVRSISPDGNLSEWKPFASLVPQVSQRFGESYLAQAAALQKYVNSVGNMFGKGNLIDDGFGLDSRMVNSFVPFEAYVAEYSGNRFEIEKFKIAGTDLSSTKNTAHDIDFLENFLHTNYPTKKAGCSTFNWIEKNRSVYLFDINFEDLDKKRKEKQSRLESIFQSEKYRDIVDLLFYNKGEIESFKDEFITEKENMLLSEYRSEIKLFEKEWNINKTYGIFGPELDSMDIEYSSRVDSLFADLSSKKITLRKFIEKRRIENSALIAKRSAILKPLEELGKIASKR